MDVALTIPVVKVPEVPLSTSVSRVLGEPAESLMVNVPFAFEAPNVTIGVVLVRARGEAPDKVTVLLAAIVVAPDIAPVFVIPPALFIIPPVIFAPPALIDNPPVVIVCAAVNELD